VNTICYQGISALDTILIEGRRSVDWRSRPDGLAWMGNNGSKELCRPLLSKMVHSMTIAIAVIGGGFSGLIFAKRLSQAGYNVTLYEEHDKVGYPEHCTGLVSGKVVRLIGEEAFSTIVSSYDGIEVCGSSSCVRLPISGGLYKLERVNLEYRLLRGLYRTADVRLGTRVSRVTYDGELKAGAQTEKYDIVIIAEGIGGRLRHQLSLGLTRTYRPLVGINAELTGNGLCKDPWPRVVFSRRLSPGFFTWSIPLQGNCLVGAASSDRYSLRWITNLKSVKRVYGGPVITGPPSTNFMKGRVYVVGDAAGMNKPLTGGGLYPSSLAAYTTEYLLEKGYRLEEALIKGINGVIASLRRVYRLAKTLHSDPELVDCAVGAIKGVIDYLGDVEYDNHAELARSILSTPRLMLRLLWNALRSCDVHRTMRAVRLIPDLMVPG